MLIKLKLGAELIKREFFRRGMRARLSKQEDALDFEISQEILFGTIPLVI